MDEAPCMQHVTELPREIGVDFYVGLFADVRNGGMNGFL